MTDGQVALDQVLVVIGSDDRLLDVLAGKGLDRGPGLPQAHRDELGAVTVHPPQRPGPAVAGRALIARDASLDHISGVGGGILGSDRAAPSGLPRSADALRLTADVKPGPAENRRPKPDGKADRYARYLDLTAGLGRAYAGR